MIPADFPEANASFRAPVDLEESQCATIPAYRGQVVGGSVDGCDLVVVAWRPTHAELTRINLGLPIFLTVIGGLPPHYLSTSFEEATHPA